MRGARPTLLAATLLILGTCIGFVPAAEEPAPLSERPLGDQDVVQMIVSGVQAAQVIERIRAHPVSFDLSDEMLRELRIAGVPETVLKAMAERQAQMAPPVPSAPADEPHHPEPPGVLLSVRFVGAISAKGGRASLWFPDRADEALARALSLSSHDPEQRVIGDLALFLACLTPEHVPDQWRSHTPLGRDFVSVPRHEVLAFAAGAQRVEDRDVPAAARSQFPAPGREQPAPGWLRLEVPDEIQAQLTPDEPHRILLGVALLVGDRYLMIASAIRPDLTPDPGGTFLKARLAQGKAARAPVAVSFEDPEP